MLSPTITWRRAPSLPGKKRRKYIAGYLTGAGGKVQDGETEEAAAVREQFEEQGVRVEESALHLGADIDFCYPHRPADNLRCIVFFTERWSGVPRESEELEPPKWYAIDRLPFKRIPPADRLWLPRTLRGSRIIATFDLTPKFEVLGGIIGEID